MGVQEQTEEGDQRYVEGHFEEGDQRHVEEHIEAGDLSHAEEHMQESNQPHQRAHPREQSEPRRGVRATSTSFKGTSNFRAALHPLARSFVEDEGSIEAKYHQALFIRFLEAGSQLAFPNNFARVIGLELYIGVPRWRF